MCVFGRLRKGGETLACSTHCRMPGARSTRSKVSEDKDQAAGEVQEQNRTKGRSKGKSSENKDQGQDKDQRQKDQGQSQDKSQDKSQDNNQDKSQAPGQGDNVPVDYERKLNDLQQVAEGAEAEASLLRTEVDDLKGNLQKAELRIAELEKKADAFRNDFRDHKEAVRLEIQGSGDGSGQKHPRQPSAEGAKWAYKSFGQLGESLLREARDPKSVPEFLAFVESLDARVEAMPPLAARFAIIRTDPSYKTYYHEFVEYLRGKKEIDLGEGRVPRVICNELLAIFHVACASMGTLTLRNYLCVFGGRPEELRNAKESDILNAHVCSDVSSKALQLARSAAWAANHPVELGEDFLTGEALCSVVQYRRALEEARRRPSVVDGDLSNWETNSMLQAATARSVSHVNSAAPPSRVAAPRAPAARPRPLIVQGTPQAAGISGTVYNVSGRCWKCARLGHSMSHCPPGTEPHRLWESRGKNLRYVLEELSAGRGGEPP